MNISKPQVFTAIVSITLLGVLSFLFTPGIVEKIVLAAIVAISNLGMMLLKANSS